MAENQTMDNVADTTETVKGSPFSLPGWISERRVQIVWMFCFSVLILVSFFAFVPVAMTMSDTDGKCFLYSDLNGYGPTSVCSYCVAITVIFLFIMCLRLIILVLQFTPVAAKIPEILILWFSVWGVHFLVLVFDLILLLLVLIMACLISVGFSSMCDDFFGGRGLCSSLAIIILPNNEKNDSFYEKLSFAEGSAWFLVCLWLVMVIVEFIFVWKEGTLGKITMRAKSFAVR